MSLRHPTINLLLGALLILAASGCSRRPAYREIHATNSYCHHRNGKAVATHTHYYGR